MNEWANRAVCKEAPAVMFPVRDSTGSRRAGVADALMVCARCPVRRECAVEALRLRADTGIWAGVDLGDGAGRISETAAKALRRVAKRGVA